ncbi:MAG: hypothetical protein HC812_12230 [Leptolyngbya sp. RL_3_1]|nr:hypothetical protein [Leptolyngbya sp. RL_3_1]
MTVATGTALTLLMSRIVKYQGIAEQINQACLAKQCPPVFDIHLSPDTESEDIYIRASKDYRFEGFGAVFGLPPKMSFWVKYMPPDAEPVEIGRFLIPIGFGDLMQI